MNKFDANYMFQYNMLLFTGLKVEILLEIRYVMDAVGERYG